VLVEPFLTALHAAVDLPGLEDRLQALCARARAAWPELVLDADELMTHLARHAPPDGVDAYLVAVHIEDLALACACHRRDDAAILELDNRHMRAIPRALARIGAAALADEVAQRLRDRFVVHGKIADYSGRGPLSAWVRAAAVRTAVDLLRAQRRAAGASEHAALPAAAVDPELELLRDRYAETIQAALQRALDTAPVRERNLLRLCYLDGLSVDEIGAIYHVHRTTAGRLVARARETLIAETRRLVRERLTLSDSDLDSLLRAVRSHLHISLTSLRY
jgi:RNA polymerase sigma-70 factor (ECF subfamily)